MGEVAVDEKVRIFAGQIYAAAGIGMWCFSRKRRLFYSTSRNQQELLAFLELSDCWDYIFQREQGWEKPLILSDSLNMIWIAHDVIGEVGRHYLLLLGPVFPSEVSIRHIHEALEQRETSVQMQRHLVRILSEVPVQSMEVLRQYAQMLHYSITEEMISVDEMYLQESEPQVSTEEPELQWKEKTEEFISADRMQQTEKILLKAVKEGNPDLKKMIHEEIMGSSAYLSETGDALRDGKNTLLMFEVLCNRAAIEGGISVYLAHEMERQKVQEIENCTTMTQLIKAREKMLDDYIQRVREVQACAQISRVVLDACGYIKAHVLETLAMEEIASAVGYTPYYFSKKFYQEMGIRVTDYIKVTRVEYAKILLVTSKKSIQDISDMLHFGTRSYFGKVFQKIVGVSPAVYREQAMGKENE